MNKSHGFQPMDKMGWSKGKNLIPALETEVRLIELHKEMERKTGIKGGKISMLNYGIVHTAIVRAITVSDDVISRMVKGAMPT